jgi:Subtilase family
MHPAKVGVHLGCILSLLSSLCSVAWASTWTISVDSRNGLPLISLGGGTALSSHFVFWGNNWKWAGMPVEFKVVGPFDYSLSGKNQTLNFDVRSHINRPWDRQLTWEFDLDARGTIANVIGGGVSFRFDLANFGSKLGEPELLPDNRGWAWGRAGGNRVEMQFDPPLASVHFEQGRKSEIRAFFYQGEVSQGQRRHTASLTISGEMVIGPTPAERFGLDDHTTWPKDILAWNVAPVDLSFLNASEKPAGKRGFVRVVNGKLVFEDGTPARFWGTNLTAYALLGTVRIDEMKRQARRLSELGFNLVRLHHHDSSWVNPNVFGDQRSRDTKTLSKAMLQRLDWWIKCLKDEGIYVWLDLHVGRQFKAGDGIEGFDEIRKEKSTADLRGYNYVNDSIREAMQRFNEQYVDRVNSATGLRYQDDPAIVGMLISNENDVTHHFGNALLPDQGVPQHTALFMAQAEAFATKHQLPKEKVWRAWEHGPSKLFLNDLEHRFNVEMIAHLRALGVKVPIATTSSWGNNPLSSLPALSAGDIVDVHSFGGVGELEKNPIYAANSLHWMAAAHIAGRPVTVSEWNVSPFPVPDRHTVPLFIASTASLHGWDALAQYAYSQHPITDGGTPSNWHSFNDPGLIATLPAAALLYRRHDVREADTVYAFAPTTEQLFNKAISPANAVALRTAAEKGKLVIALPRTRELPWLESSPIPIGATVITDPQQTLIDSGASEATSDTGQLRRNWEEGTYTINTARTQAAMGWIGGKEISLADVDIVVTTRNATVAVQSLDGKNIGESRSVLISLGSRSIPRSDNQLPFYSEPVIGRLTIRGEEGLRLYVKGPAAREVPISYENGRYQINLDRNLGSYWLLLQPEVTAQVAARPQQALAPGPRAQQAVQRIIDIPPLTETRFVPDQVLLQIRCDGTVQRLEQEVQRFGLAMIASRDLCAMTGTIAAQFRIINNRAVRDIIRQLASVRIIAIAQPNYLYTFAQQLSANKTALAAEEGDPGQYVLEKLKLPEVHRVARGRDVPIAVIDSEIDATHPDLRGAIAQRFDAVGAPEKPHAHGTGMAGAIAAHRKLLGIAPSARLYAVRAFTTSAASAESNTFNLLNGLNWAASQGARVVNMSFAGPKDPSLGRLLKAAYDRGIVLIAAAGNAGPKSPPLYPGADPSVIAVTATDVDDKLFTVASRGKHIALAAPGVDVLVPAPDNGYQVTTGTSVAAAEVSGVVALLLERNPRLTPADVRRILTGSAKPLTSGERDDNLRAGLVDPLRALTSAVPRTAITMPAVPQR